ncbi:DNA-binding transcriptional LysR family regulator [Dysgonomonas sp. PFB1-18]|uniref:LysR substrate-binding domain-containing protein n=1 Tax=unclassified Dysgonomonas TaxID=2630389 RepID=UPI002474661D|nr:MULTISPECIES: LysR substrate-binding domain-containing protein [unclassified Dysgonomonas]MDH6311136.1 DNA-binding transcriptional LysR family regulator [Dysgonomonas sp. PF1-14]MDH6341010.1 DNA-binding transcriptional LysR family regulator [Dysgonomonas sp. PF1-16]MDH6382650.1 DNA-binding transcriptional LysR family regulator [Dysgonomonas sp. PFB1-18]MDH6400001.1 DNA-binding transcriptional LysR family regulator [Dysgonomonas sp. PF1-23]
MFNFRLHVFHSVAVNLSFTKAAKELHITQPAVTSNVKELENSLGISLFDRDPNGISLTKAGEILLKYTEQVTAEYKIIEYEIGLLRKSFSGELKIGASTTIEQYILPPILAKFNKKYPEIEISLYNGNTMNVEKDVLSHKIDLGIVEGNIGRKEFKYVPFMKDEIVAFAHTSQPIAKKQQLGLEELKQTPLVLRETGSGTLDIITNELQKHRIKLKDMNVKVYLGSTESIKNFLANSNCMGLVSVYAIKREVKEGYFQIIDIDDLDIIRTFNFISPQGKQNGLVNKFIEFCLTNKE